MFGFNIIINGKASSRQDDICYNNIICQNLMIHKFEQDKLFINTDEFIVLLDGVILNKKELLKESQIVNGGTWSGAIIELYRDKGERFFDVLRGSFAGALFDKEKNKWIIFGDQLGTKYVYYTHVGGFFSCAEMCDVLYENLRINNIEYHLDYQNARLLLSYGFMVEDRTLCDTIKKIQPGCYLVYENGDVKEKRYYMLDNTPNDEFTEQETIDKIDHYFRQAVIRQFEKDNEYGYKHIVALSAGLDSRMTSFVAHDCGYTDQLNCTFSQTDYWDETVPKEMASYMKHEWLFKALDNGIWLKDVDEVTELTGGNVAYYTIAHGNSLLKYINFDQLGLSHTGQIGDSTISTNCRPNQKFEFGHGAYNEASIKIVNIKPKMEFENAEIGFYYYRALSGANAGIQYLYNYTETLSPFLDLDFLEFALSIPWKYRHSHYIYHKWIIQKYPQAAQFVWEKIGCKITDRTIELGGRIVPVKKVFAKTMARLGIYRNGGTNSIKNMNPYGYYMATNESLKPMLYQYFDYLDYINDDELKVILQRIKESGKPIEILLAVSLLASVKKYYCNK